MNLLFFYLREFKLNRRRTPKDQHTDLQATLFIVHLFYDAIEVGEIEIGDLEYEVEINDILRAADEMIRRYGFALPPFAYWSPEEFRARSAEARHVIDARSGWVVARRFKLSIPAAKKPVKRERRNLKSKKKIRASRG